MIARVALALAIVAAALAAIAATAQADPISWDAPVQIDPGGAAPLNAISCPSAACAWPSTAAGIS